LEWEDAVYTMAERGKPLVVVSELAPDFARSNVNPHLLFHIPLETMTTQLHLSLLCSGSQKVLPASPISKLCWPLPVRKKPPQEHLHCHNPPTPFPAVKLPYRPPPWIVVYIQLSAVAISTLSCASHTCSLC